jgi:hypothetical protein
MMSVPIPKITLTLLHCACKTDPIYSVILFWGDYKKRLSPFPSDNRINFGGWQVLAIHINQEISSVSGLGLFAVDILDAIILDQLL